MRPACFVDLGRRRVVQPVRMRNDVDHRLGVDDAHVLLFRSMHVDERSQATSCSGQDEEVLAT